MGRLKFDFHTGCAPRASVVFELNKLLRTSRCTHITTTPPLLSTCVGGRYPDLKVVALGGEALPMKLVEACGDRDFSLVSVYGVTECCVYQTHRLVKTVGECGLLGAALVGTISLEDGEVVLRGPLVDGASYLGGENGGHGADGRGRYYRTGDGVVVEDGAIRLQGRRQCHSRSVRPPPTESRNASIWTNPLKTRHHNNCTRL